MKLNHKYERITRRNLLASASSSHPVIILKDSSTCTFDCPDDSFSSSMVILNFLFLLFSQAETQLRERERERDWKKKYICINDFARSRFVGSAGATRFNAT